LAIAGPRASCSSCRIRVPVSRLGTQRQSAMFTVFCFFRSFPLSLAAALTSRFSEHDITLLPCPGSEIRASEDAPLCLQSPSAFVHTHLLFLLSPSSTKRIFVSLLVAQRPLSLLVPPTIFRPWAGTSPLIFFDAGPSLLLAQTPRSRFPDPSFQHPSILSFCWPFSSPIMRILLSLPVSEMHSI